MRKDLQIREIFLIKLIKKLIEKKQFPNSLILSGQKGVGKSLIARNIAYCLVDCIKLDELNYINNKDRLGCAGRGPSRRAKSP